MITKANLEQYYLDRIPYPEDYSPSDWVKSVVNKHYKGNNITYICIGYDPSCGFWMENINSKELINISERAIDRTFHKVRNLESKTEIFPPKNRYLVGADTPPENGFR